MRWALIALVVALAAVGAAVALWWPPAPAPAQRATATVVEPASCGGGDAYDRVELKVGEQTRRARLDGCGHSVNEVVEVVVPADTSGEFLVQAAGTMSDDLPFGTRLTAMLMCLSGLAGGLYTYLLLRRQRTASTVAA
ncbi:hypothetical protein GCM10010185_37320 [Saccharothrix coeruleofusca]|uniref:Uncharacterized protein n=1 Tax=Saccharothrix coeruleofusca TaxID=33919 RepID=A0A918ARA1_9PSEU|nr:hypothetical protein GCM10010185_37320 [Saccharothrix coeruleofusca]